MLPCTHSYVTQPLNESGRVSTLAAWQEEWETLDASASKATTALEKTREEADKIDELKKEKDEEWVPKKCRWTDMMCTQQIQDEMAGVSERKP